MPSNENFIENIASFYESIILPGGYSFSWPKTLKKIDLYYNSKFETGETDGQGFRKYFFNVVKPACDIATKFIDLDTKDINLVSVRPDDDLRVWLMQRDLKQWFRDTNFGSLLNEISHNYPKYGLTVLKKVDGELKFLNIQNLRFDVTHESLLRSPYVYELHRVTAKEIEQEGWSTKEIPKDVKFINVFEMYEYLDGKKWARTVLADPFKRRKPGGEGFERVTEAQVSAEDDFVPAIKLEEDEKALPYRDLYWEKIPGRLPGQGFVEYLFENQVSENEAENLERKGLYWKALQLYQTRDETVGRNVFTSHENGDILKVNSEITPLVKDNSDLAAFNNTRSRWQRNSEQKTFSFDISRGEQLPSRTPLGVAQLSAGMVASYFDLKRENYGLFLKKVLTEDIIPEFENKSKKTHILTFMGSDSEIEKLDRAIAEVKVNKEAIKHAKKTGFMPSTLELDVIKSRIELELKDKKNRYLDIPDGFYKEVKYLVDVIVTGEEIDTGARTQTLTVALQIIGSNPAILQDKTTRTVFFKLLELAGIPPLEISALVEEQQTQPATIMPQGGSVAIPASGGARPVASQLKV